MRFEPADADLFFGREETTDRLEAMARRHRLSVVVGASGSGKSSLLRAGLIPRLRRPGRTRASGPPRCGSSPRARPMDHAERLTPAEGPERPGCWWISSRSCSPSAPPRRARRLPHAPAGRAGPGQPTAGRPRAARRLHGPVHREPGAGRRARRRHAPGLPHDHGAVTDGHRPPGAGARPERGARPDRPYPRRRRGEPGALPLMSHALLETWRRRGRVLTLQSYEAVGGLRGPSPAPPRTPTVGSPRSGRTGPPHPAAPDRARRRHRGHPPAHSPQRVRGRLPGRHGRRRRPPGPARPGSAAHRRRRHGLPRPREADPRLAPAAGWIDEERDRIRLHRQLTQDAATWHRLDRDPGPLPRRAPAPGRGSLLRTLARGAQPLETDFLNASVAAGHRHERRTRGTLITLATLLCVALVAASVAYRQRDDAEHQRRLAVSRELAAHADQASEQNPESAMLLALKGYRQADTATTRGSLLSAYARYHATQLTGHTSAVQSTAYSPDGHILATASFDHGVKLWDARSHRLLATLLGHTGAVNTVAFSPDGRTSPPPGTTTASSCGTPAPTASWPPCSATPTRSTASRSPRRHHLATAGADRTVRLWAARGNHRALAVLSGHEDAVLRLSFSPDGRTLASADSGRATRLWDTSSHRRPRS
ncbi:hypothetical protein NKH77_08290 [Streptomyces sp. M19]